MLGALAEFQAAEQEYEALVSQRAASRDPTRRWLQGGSLYAQQWRVPIVRGSRWRGSNATFLIISGDPNRLSVPPAGVLEKPATAAGEARAIGAMVRELQAVLDAHAVPVRLEATRVPCQFRAAPSGAVLNLKRQQGELLGRCGGGYESVMKLLGGKIRVPQ